MDDGTYTAEFNDSVKDKLTLRYIDEEQTNKNEEESREFDDIDIFDKYNDLNDMFDGIEESVSKLDDNQW
jgi:hypothetical protein